MGSSGSSTHAPTPWKRLRGVLLPERGDLWVVLIYGVAVSVLSLVVPVAAQALVNTAAFGTLLQPLLVLSVVVVGVLIIAAVLRALQVIVAEVIQQRLFARMAIDVAYRLPRVRLDAYDTHKGADLVNRFMDVMTIQKTSALILLDGFTLVLQALMGLALLAFYNPILLGFDVLLILGMGFVLFVLGRNAVRTSISESYAKYEVIGWLEELARVPLAFRGNHGAALALRRADEVTHEYLVRRKAHFRILFRQIAGSLSLQAIASGLLLGLGGWLVARQQLTLGQLVAAELVVTPVVNSFAKFGKYLEGTYDLLAAVDKVGHLFDLPLVRGDGEGVIPAAATTPAAALRLRQLGFKHEERASFIFSNASVSVAPGERLALTGPHGSGKSTLLDTLIGIRPAVTGAVELDAIDIRELSSEALHQQVVLVRGIHIFDGTLLENIRVGREDVPLHEVHAVLERLGLLEELTGLPNGLQTRITSGQPQLSTGQAQRLMLARALVGRPRMLVLDEALDGLSRDVRAKVMEAVLGEGRQWTVVLATHVPEVAGRCDRVLRLSGGVLEEVPRS
ncbi:MAG TPA: ATP-binding cassette domain-containing protein [Longimicrobium sp.]|nr:ATP-binding cassette domain-containing protein [Longimicrobium sp.]